MARSTITNADRDRAISTLFAAQRAIAQRQDEIIVVVNSIGRAVQRLEQAVEALALSSAVASAPQPGGRHAE
jgi:hypothetical protein